MIVGVIGAGFVGSSVIKACNQHFPVKVHDIKYGTTIKDVLGTDVVFVCVPSPTKNGVQDLSILEGVCAELAAHKYRGSVCIKSTVLPGTCAELAQKTGLSIVHNPEFLTERRAALDFLEQPCVLLGGENHQPVGEVYAKILPKTPQRAYLDPHVTEIAKYVHNCFLAVKVGFMNDIYELCQVLSVNYDDVRNGFLSQERILANHTKVPGPDGAQGYGGTCFPKDTKALSTYFVTKGLVSEILDATIAANIDRRPEAEL